jgi:hypothetical protein
MLKTSICLLLQHTVLKENNTCLNCVYCSKSLLEDFYYCTSNMSIIDQVYDFKIQRIDIICSKFRLPRVNWWQFSE